MPDFTALALLVPEIFEFKDLAKKKRPAAGGLVKIKFSNDQKQDFYFSWP